MFTSWVVVESGFILKSEIRIRYACVYLGGGLQRRYLALTRSSRFECELSNMSCWFLLVVFLLLQVVFLFVLVKVRVFDSPVSGQTLLRFPGIICSVVVPEPFDVVFHRVAFLLSVCHYLLDLVLNHAVSL